LCDHLFLFSHYSKWLLQQKFKVILICYHIKFHLSGWFLTILVNSVESLNLLSKIADWRCLICWDSISRPLTIKKQEIHLFICVTTGHGSNHSTTFHLHGYNFLVLGSESLDHPIDVAEVQLSDSHGLLSRNLVDAPRKDTVVVPSKGYTIIRLFTDNPG
jgi:hypothetical protein